MPGHRRAAGATDGRRAALAALLPALVLGCGSPEAEATGLATEQVRASAEGVLARLQQVGVATPEGGGALLERSASALPVGPDVLLFGREVVDGTAVVRLAFHARGEAGGGGTYTAVVARLCVQYRVEASRGAEVTDIPCDPALPRSTGNAGNVTLDVALA